MIVNVSAKRISFPRMCACCGKQPDTEYQATAVRVTGKRVVSTRSATWAIPYCQECLGHASLWPKPWGCRTLFVVLITGFIWLPVQVLIDSAARANSKRRCSATCCTPDYAAKYIGWNGTVESFEFASIPYAIEFILANRNRVTNLTFQQEAEIKAYLADKLRLAEADAKSLIEQANEAPAEALNTVLAREERIIVETLERIEKAKGPAARQNLLRSALDQVSTPELQSRLMTEGAKVEVHAVLDKVDSLKSKAAKRRHIEAALAQVRSDSIPDEMQAQEISWLEDALKELGTLEKPA